MPFRLEPIHVATGEEGEARLVFHDGRLVAVLVRLSDLHGQEAGWWFLEKGFGSFDAPFHVSFPDLQAAEAWLRSRLRGGGGAPHDAPGFT